MKQPYFDSIYYEKYAIPNNLDISKIRKHSSELAKEMRKLAHIITEWCINIELSTDMIERAEALHLYNSKQKEM